MNCSTAELSNLLDKLAAWVTRSLVLNKRDIGPQFGKSYSRLATAIVLALNLRIAPAVAEAPVLPDATSGFPQAVGNVDLPENGSISDTSSGTQGPSSIPIDLYGASAVIDRLLLSIRRKESTRVLPQMTMLETWELEYGDNAAPAIRSQVLTLIAEAEFYIVAEAYEQGCPFSTSPIRERIQRAEAIDASGFDADTYDRLVCLDARVKFIDGHREEVLHSLGESTSPLPFKLRLIVLQEPGQLEEANGLLEGMQPSPRWVGDVGVFQFLG